MLQTQISIKTEKPEKYKLCKWQQEAQLSQTGCTSAWHRQELNTYILLLLCLYVVWIYVSVTYLVFVYDSYMISS